MEEVNEFICSLVSKEQDIPIEQIDIDQPLEEMNLDSLTKLSLAFEIETKYDLKDLDPSILKEHNTIRKLSEWILMKKR